MRSRRPFAIWVSIWHQNSWSASLPFGRPDGEETVEVDLREYVGQWFQIRFFGFVSGAADGGVSRWAVDDIQFTGIENEPFAIIVPQGEAP